MRFRPILVTTLGLVLLPALAAAAVSIWPAFPGSTLPVVPVGLHTGHTAVADGAGGFFAVVSSTGDNVVRVQHVLASGRIAAGWPADGVQLGAATGMFTNPSISPDGLGGVLVSFERASGSNDVFVQRLTSAGAVAPSWPVAGRAVSSPDVYDYYSNVTADGSGGAFVAYVRSSDSQVLVHHVLPGGTLDPAWPSFGREVQLEGTTMDRPQVFPDGEGGALAVFKCTVLGTPALRIARVLPNGKLATGPLNGSLSLSVGAVGDWDAARDAWGRVVVAWGDQRSDGQYDLYVDAFDANDLLHNVPPGGLKVTGTSSNESAVDIMTDAQGNAGLAWIENNGVTVWVRALLLGSDQSPAAGWPSDGADVYSSPFVVYPPSVVADGAGGVIAAWGTQSNYLPEVRASRLKPDGTLAAGWSAGGNLLASAYGSGELRRPLAFPDGDGGVIACFSQSPPGYPGTLNGQRLRANGQSGLFMAPRFTALNDVANDQGGKLALYWKASEVDTLPANATGSYMLWRRMPALAALARLASGAQAPAGNEQPSGATASAIRVVASAATTEYWEYMGATPARGWAGYGQVVNTRSDLAGPMYPTPFETFVVETVSPAGAVLATSTPDSAYSTDNLSPGMPALFTAARSGGATHLAWARNLEGDFGAYRLYRGADASFVPDDGHLIAVSTEPGYVDGVAGLAWYKLAALDVHGNVSAYAVLSPAQTLDAPAPTAGVLAFAPVSPNPVRGAASLEFALPARGLVTLSVFDAQGRRVREVLRATLAAGAHRASWDLRDDAGRSVAPGLYLARLESSAGRLTQRVAVIH